MGFTLNRTIRKDFPDLGDDAWVEIRNPKLLPQDRLRPKREIRTLPDGTLDMDDAATLGYERLAAIISAWHLPDCSDPDAVEPEALGDITPANCRRLPAIVEAWVARQMSEASLPSS